VGATRGPRKAQDHVLPRQSDRQRLAVQIPHRQRKDIRALVIDRRHPELPKSWCNRMRSCCRRERGVAASLGSRLALQQCLDRRTPSGRKRRDTRSALQSIAPMIGRIEERVDFCDGHSLFRFSHLHDFVAGAHLAFLQDAEVESRPSARSQQCRHPGLVHPNANAVAGHARLSDLE
jgi:hypothetical protein